MVEFNSSLTGRWNQGGGKIGQITSGSYDPKTRKLVFQYYQSWNDMNGTATFTLSEDGNRLSGAWTQQRGSNPTGSGGSGGWTMTRDSSPEIARADKKELSPEPGDIVLYKDGDSYSHVAVIVEGGVNQNPDGTTTVTKVRSKWSAGATYDHDPNDYDSHLNWTVWRRIKKPESCKGRVTECNWLDTYKLAMWSDCNKGIRCFATDRGNPVYVSIQNDLGQKEHSITDEHPLGHPTAERVDPPIGAELSASVKEQLLKYDCRGFVFGRKEAAITEQAFPYVFLSNQVQTILDDGYTQIHAKDTKGKQH